jgi:hypothetical protein
MPTETKTRLVDYLPAVFRQDDAVEKYFLGRFLRAFEAVFEGVQLELDAIPDLFALLVPRALQADAAQGAVALELDTAAGLCADDVLHLQDAQTDNVEFVVVRESPELGSRTVTLAGQPRFDHAQGTPVAVVRAPVTRTVLTLSSSSSVLSVENVAALEVEEGDVLIIGENEAVEYAQARSVAAAQKQITVTPSLQNRHEAGASVRRTRRPFDTVPPPAFAHARERGRQFLSWLAGWVGLRLRQDQLHPQGLSDEQWEQRQFEWNRRFVQETISTVAWRGTRVGLDVFLNAFLRDEAMAEVVDLPNPLQIGLVSTVGVDTIICGSAPYFFYVNVTTEPTRRDLRNWMGLDALIRATKSVVSEEKPAHTRNALRLQAHTMQVGQYSTVGEDTLLWTKPLVIQETH